MKGWCSSVRFFTNKFFLFRDCLSTQRQPTYSSSYNLDSLLPSLRTKEPLKSNQNCITGSFFITACKNIEYRDFRLVFSNFSLLLGIFFILFATISSVYCATKIAYTLSHPNLSKTYLAIKTEDKTDHLASNSSHDYVYEQQLKLRLSAIDRIFEQIATEENSNFYAQDADMESTLSDNISNDSIPRRLNGHSMDAHNARKLSSSRGVGGSNIADLLSDRRPLKFRGISSLNLTANLFSTSSTERILLSYADAYADNLEFLPIGSPIDGDISSSFGLRKSPFSGRVQNHAGMDIACERGSMVVASGTGLVVKSDYLGGYGLVVILDHGDGFQSVYGHLDKAVKKEGDIACKGQVIGYVGSTGNSTGPHLHYEVRVGGQARDPADFIKLSATITKFAKLD